MTPRTLVVESRDAGFFSNFNCVMNNLDAHLGRNGCIAAEVNWLARPELKHFAYGKPEDGNIWNHFFEPLKFQIVPPERFYVNEYALETACHISAQDVYVTYRLNPLWRRNYHELFRRHIKIREFITGRVQEIYQQVMAGRVCIGVHYRNPQHDFECLKPMPSPEVFIERVRRMLPARRPAAVVLASDFEPAVSAFRTAFGEQLVLQPLVRRAASATEEPLHHGAQDPGLALGEQVLVDCLLLSRCNALLHVNSNVATAAAFINPKLKLVYCETRMQSCQNFIWAVLRAIEWRTGDWWEPAKYYRRKVNELSRKKLPLLLYRLCHRLLG